VRRKKDATPETIGDPAPTPLIREQISQMAPMTLADMASAPENTDDVAPESDAPYGYLPNGRPRKRRPSGTRRTSSDVSDDPLMNDPRYVEAIQDVNFYGASRIIKRGFKMGEKIMRDPDIALTTEEERHVDNYFYALSKHAKFDPMASLIGRIILFVLLMGELIAWRWLKYSPLGAQLKKMMDEKTKENPPSDDPASIM
jgi:hypothetical protein